MTELARELFKEILGQRDFVLIELPEELSLKYLAGYKEHRKILHACASEVSKILDDSEENSPLGTFKWELTLYEQFIEDHAFSHGFIWAFEGSLDIRTLPSMPLQTLIDLPTVYLLPKATEQAERVAALLNQHRNVLDAQKMSILENYCSISLEHCYMRSQVFVIMGYVSAMIIHENEYPDFERKSWGLDALLERVFC